MGYIIGNYNLDVLATGESNEFVVDKGEIGKELLAVRKKGGADADGTCGTGWVCGQDLGGHRAGRSKLMEQAKKSKSEYLVMIAEASGMKPDEVKRLVAEAKEKYGIGYKSYYKYKCWKMSEKKLKAFGKETEYAKLAAAERGMEISQIRRDMHDAKRKYAIGPAEYYNKRVWEMTEEELEGIKGKEDRRSAVIRRIANTAGIPEKEMKSMVLRAGRESGAYLKDFKLYRFWEIPEDEWNTYVTKGYIRNVIRKKYNSEGDHTVFTDKSRFNSIFSHFMNRKWTSNINTSFDEFSATFNGIKKIIYKPMEASCGRGIQVFDIDNTNLEDIFDELSRYPAGVVEEYIVQHPDIGKFAPSSVNTVRVVTIYDGKNTNIIYAGLRIGEGNSFVDNFHSGGMVALIDINTGIIDMDAVNMQREVFEEHPMTHEKIKGTVIPYWREIRDMVDKAARIVPNMGYLGWDVAVTENGPLLIEANTTPWPGIIQLPHSVFNKKGMREVFKLFE